MKIKILVYLFFFLCIVYSCSEATSNEAKQESNKNELDSLANNLTKDSLTIRLSNCKSDSLDELAFLISGKDYQNSKILSSYFNNNSFKFHEKIFQTKWDSFQKNRITKLISFQQKELNNEVGKTETLFYPFSGPDILHAQLFFPDAKQYVLMGLEPVGSLPVFEHPEDKPDSMSIYYNKINKSLHAILNYSFFRTISMSNDLKNQDVDGTLHLLLLFLNRQNNSICSVKPFVLDSSGNLNYQKDFLQLKKINSMEKGTEIKFTTSGGEQKLLHYFSIDLSNGAYSKNKSVINYLNKLNPTTTYLKGASYLMHNPNFSLIREYILNTVKNVVQDDSGISFRYFEQSGKWNYSFYGEYVKPIKLFATRYQKDLDSMYKKQGSKSLGFGLGYNFQDKNSNLMIAKKK
jgi:hypothetical protein